MKNETLLPLAHSEADCCLLDAFCEEEGFAFAKLDEVEWQVIQHTHARSKLAAQAEPDPAVCPAFAAPLDRDCPPLARCV